MSVDLSPSPPSPAPSSPKLPTFAVVGRVNEGKSSIVAALTENPDIEIGPEPGTTREATPYFMECEGRRLFAIVDTPGFQEPEAAFAWLQGQAHSAGERPAAIRRFLAEFSGGPRFVDECRLLSAVMAGASVLYVVDCSHPYRASYECEMQILRWTGQPCFALLNQTNARDFADEWRTALKQYFNAVRPFNAQRNLFADRLSLLTMLSELDDEARPALLTAIDALQRRQAQRYAQAADVIAAMLGDLVALRVAEPSQPGATASLDATAKMRLEERFHAAVARGEAAARAAVEEFFNHRRLMRVEGALGRPLFDRDLRSAETWELLGQSKLRLVAAGTLGGALVGGTIDAMTLGHSFLAGTLIGGGLGGLGSAITVVNAMKSPEMRLLGMTISRTETVVGPHRNPNFAWILLDRALLHFRALQARSHAAPAAAQLDATTGKQGLVATLSKTQTAQLASLFHNFRAGRVRDGDRQTLRRVLGEVLPKL